MHITIRRTCKKKTKCNDFVDNFFLLFSALIIQQLQEISLMSFTYSVILLTNTYIMCHKYDILGLLSMILQVVSMFSFSFSDSGTSKLLCNLVCVLS